MHPSSFKNAEVFFATYAKNIINPTIVDIGAQDVNGSLKKVAPKLSNFIGVDFVAGKGVDIVLEDPYKLPFEDNSIDIVVSNSCFEHSEMFWVLFEEVIRILKPTGLFYLNVPSNGPFHRYPVDCWRFYPDSGNALVKWANKSGYSSVLLESFVSKRYRRIWNDYVAIFLKDRTNLEMYKERILDVKKDFYNGLGTDDTTLAKHRIHPQSYSSFLHNIKTGLINKYRSFKSDRS
jgi:SAM-dependent methyltransferase